MLRASERFQRRHDVETGSVSSKTTRPYRRSRSESSVSHCRLKSRFQPPARSKTSRRTEKLAPQRCGPSGWDRSQRFNHRSTHRVKSQPFQFGSRKWISPPTATTFVCVAYSRTRVEIQFPGTTLSASVEATISPLAKEK